MLLKSLLRTYKKQKQATKNLTPFAREFMSLRYNHLLTKDNSK